MTDERNRNREPGLARRAARCAALAGLFAAVHVGAYWLRFDGPPRGEAFELFRRTVGLFVLVKLLAFGRYGIPHRTRDFVTFHDLLVIVKAATGAALALAIADYLIAEGFTVPRSVLLADWGATIMVLGGLLSAARWARERGLVARLGEARGRRAVRALIVGANDAGEALFRAICRDSALPYHVVGFIADRAESGVRRVGPLAVVGNLDATCEVAERLRVREILIAAGDLPGQVVRRLVEEGARRGIGVKVVPGHHQLLEGRVDVRPRSVSIEDLLRREPVRLDHDGLHRWLSDRIVMVTGSAGSIGSEICRQVLQYRPARLVAVDRSECGQFFLERELSPLDATTEVDVVLGDLNDGIRMSRIFSEYHPQVVIHAAAYKHVPLMERHPGEAVKNITLATRSLVDLSNQHGVESFVMISTDKAVRPSSVMGACKRMAELWVQAQANRSQCRFMTVRFGNVLDSAGSVVPIFREQIARGGPVTVTHPEMRRYFMTIPEASQLVLQAGMMGRGGEIFVLDMGTPVRIVDLARDLIRLSGLREGPDIAIDFTGLRPGEKLDEELLGIAERIGATPHPKILVAQGPRPDLPRILERLNALRRIADGPEDDVVREIAEIVPDFAASPRSESDDRSDRRAA
ncbi:MAG: polysaccharide biosynthesis protein [Planctomycetes bacterium]|nr:polysaccharide biosynthesis protein [Planctomycetota bacterium]